jgi:TetR/AcrR family transcriptional regulator
LVGKKTGLKEGLTMPIKTNNIEDLSEPSVRHRLLSKATELFARKGYAATTVREIVTAAGVTKPVLYYYFRNKEGLFLELMQEAWERFGDLIDHAHKKSGAVRGKILHLIERVYELFLDQIEVARIGYSIYYGPPQGAPFFDFDAYHLKFQGVVSDLVREGIEKNEFRKGNILEMTWAIIGVVNVAIEVRLGHPEMAVNKKELARILDLVFDGIKNRERKAE